MKKYMKICLPLVFVLILAVIIYLAGGRKANRNDQADITGFPLAYSNCMPGNSKYELLSETVKKVPIINVGEVGWDSVDVLNPSVIKFNGQYYNYYSGYDGEVWRTGLAISENGESWTKIENNPILDIRKDEWDNSYIAANGSAVCFKGKVYYFYHGTNAENGKAEIGLAISENGEFFDFRTDEPVLKVGMGASWDASGVADPYVIVFDDKLYMYYLGMDEFGVQKLGVAVSSDGMVWNKYERNPIMDVGVSGSFDEKGLGEPSVIYNAPYFWMLYTGRNAIEQRNIGIGVSLDGINWKKLNYEGIIDLQDNSWNSQVMCDTSLLREEDGTIRAWYGGGNVPAPAQNINGKIGVFDIILDGVVDAASFHCDSIPGEIAKDFIKGCYGIEGEEGSRNTWCGKEIYATFENWHDADDFVVNGYFNYDIFEKAGVSEVRLTAYINDVMVGEKIFAESENFEWVLKKPEEAGGEYLNLRIVASDGVVPKKYNMGNDERELAWMLKSIRQGQ